MYVCMYVCMYVYMYVLKVDKNSSRAGAVGFFEVYCCLLHPSRRQSIHTEVKHSHTYTVLTYTLPCFHSPFDLIFRKKWLSFRIALVILQAWVRGRLIRQSRKLQLALAIGFVLSVCSSVLYVCMYVYACICL